MSINNWIQKLFRSEENPSSEKDHKANQDYDREFEKRNSVAQEYLAKATQRMNEDEEVTEGRFVYWVSSKFNLPLDEALELVERSKQRGLVKERQFAKFHLDDLLDKCTSQEDRRKVIKEMLKHHPCGARGTMGYVAAMKEDDVKVWIENDYLCIHWKD